MISIIIGLLRSLVFKKTVEGIEKFSLQKLLYIAVGLVVLFLYLSNSNKNTEIANLNLRISGLETDLTTVKSNLNSCNTKVDKQNEAALAVSNLVTKLDNNLRNADFEKQQLESKVKELTLAKAPKDCDGATNWLVDKSGELKKWAN